MKKIACLLVSVALLFTAGFAEQADYGEMSLEELNRVIELADKAISDYHTVSYSLGLKLSRLTRDLVGSRLTTAEVDWTDADWLYERQWDQLTVNAVASIKRDATTSSCDVTAVFLEDGDTCVPVLLTIDDETVFDSRNGAETPISNPEQSDTDQNQPTVEFVDDIAADDWDEDIQPVSTDYENIFDAGSDDEIAPATTPAPTAEPTPEATPQSTPEPAPETTPSENVDVVVAKLKDRGDAVKQIQTWLSQLGYLDERADGIYGKNTSEAVKAFQASRGDEITGSVTQTLFSALRDAAQTKSQPAAADVPQTTPSPDDNVIIAQSASKGDVVKDIQTRLIKLGYLTGVADGRYGSKTSKAVSAFQRASGLNETGKVTKGLYNRMLSLTRRASIVGFDSFLMVFNETEKWAGVNVELKSPEIPQSGGTVTYKIDQYTTVKIVVDGFRAVKTVTVEGVTDGFAEGEQSTLSAYQSSLVGCGVVTGPLEGRKFLETIGAYKNALIEKGEGSTIIDDIKYAWSAADARKTLTITVEI